MQRYTVPVLITVICFGLILLILSSAIALNAEEYTNPLAPYDSLMPGQPEKALRQFQCASLYTVFWGDEPTFYCVIEPDDKVVSLIWVSVQYGMIQRLTFSLSEGVRVGDLVGRWGKPDVVAAERSYYALHWNGGVFASVKKVWWFNYQSSVQSVSISISHTPHPS